MESPSAAAAAAAAPPRRRPLQPRNFNCEPSLGNPQKPKAIFLRFPPANGEGVAKRDQHLSSPAEPPMESGLLRESSLGEELAAIRSRRERLRVERERTEKALRERDALMQRWAVELEKWADEQRNLELEFRLLIQLQDLRCSSMVWSPVQSLREQEQQRSMEDKLQSPVQSSREKERLKIMEMQLQGPDGAKQDTEVDQSSSTRGNESE